VPGARVSRALILAGLLGGAVTIAFLFVLAARDPERDGSLERIRRNPARLATLSE
jgi:hypothetical protein